MGALGWMTTGWGDCIDCDDYLDADGEPWKSALWGCCDCFGEPDPGCPCGGKFGEGDGDTGWVDKVGGD